MLRIRLAGGGVASGTVDEVTDVSCETETRLERTQRGVARRGLRAGRRGRGRGRHSGRHSRAAQAPGEDEDSGENDYDEDESYWDEDALDDDESSEDESGEDSGDEGWDDEDAASDEAWEDEPANGGACLAKRLRRGARVHQSELADSSFSAVVAGALAPTASRPSRA